MGLVSPILTYVFIHFRPTDPTTQALAQHILADIRLPHHADIASWFGWIAVIQYGLMCAGLLGGDKRQEAVYGTRRQCGDFGCPDTHSGCVWEQVTCASISLASTRLARSGVDGDHDRRPRKAGNCVERC